MSLIEADLLLAYVEWLLNLQSAANSPPVTASEIDVITPYTGQAAYIRQQVAQRQIAKGFKVLTSQVVQSDEGKIVLLSLVRNVPDKVHLLAFIADKKQLCVNLCRAMLYLVIFGDWTKCSGQAMFARTEETYH